ncbi:uncharacterized protein LOC124656334 [Lolium rigidum]|uniref:uncharacterized protein LOC124656334 n=1 Tax=Lolium rigidum TaxID=89674 RepID=UPI001F5D29B5|nr:uncharacterized protein LOC124656334 [Lolium rigidum]
MAQRQVRLIQASGFDAAKSFFQHVKAASHPAVYAELLRLLRGLSTGETADRRDVADKACALLRGHPDLVRRFHAFLPDEHAPEPEPAREDNATAVAAPTRPKRERRPTAAAVDDDDADIRRALLFLERVKKRAGPLYERLLALLFQVGSDETLDGNQIYSMAREVFGSAHVALLREFTKYLPTGADFPRRRAKKEPPLPLEHRAPAPKRKAGAADDKPPIAAKRPRAEGRKTTNSRRASSPAVVDARKSSVSRDREAWEFETTYTKLVATIRRTEELLKQYDPPEDEDAPPPPPPRGHRAFEELFPDRECQEVLREMYHDMLEPIQEALEDGERTEVALRTIKRRLGMLEQVAVKIAMERRDRARVEARMCELAVDRVLRLRKEEQASVRGRVRPARREALFSQHCSPLPAC